MDEQKNKINTSYTHFYSARKHNKVYPTEFVVRTLLGDYPGLSFRKPRQGDSILDVAFGDGRNTAFLCDLGLDVHGIEITEDIVRQTGKRLSEMGCEPVLKTGRNSSIPYENKSFDYILACHCCYYCDEGETLLQKLQEYSRVLKKNGVLIASVADNSSYIFEGAEKLTDGTWRISNDPYNNRIGYRLHAFGNSTEIAKYFGLYFGEFCFGYANNDYFGLNERVFWVVCQKT